MTDNQADEVDDKLVTSPVIFRDNSCFSEELSKIENVTKYMEKRYTSKAVNYHEQHETYCYETNTQNLVKPFLDML